MPSLFPSTTTVSTLAATCAEHHDVICMSCMVKPAAESRFNRKCSARLTSEFDALRELGYI